MAIRTAVNRALTAITALPTAAALTDGNLTLLTTVTASSSSTVTFDSSINSTYNSYLFKFVNVHASNDDAEFNVNFRDGSTAYDATKTSSSFRTYADEADSDTTLGYYTAGDVAQGTGVQRIAGAGIGADNDQCVSGKMHLFDPSNTTFVKHFMARTQTYMDRDTTQLASTDNYCAGYVNTTSAVNAISFRMNDGNIDSGTFKLYGVK